MVVAADPEGTTRRGQEWKAQATRNRSQRDVEDISSAIGKIFSVSFHFFLFLTNFFRY
jgi:hypothetical protein